jgi:hypothetical protein
MKPLFVFLSATIICSTNINAQKVIKIDEVNKHMGDTVKICNKIYSGIFYNRMQGSPTYMYMGNNYPNHTLAILISKKDRGNFEDRPEMMYAYKDVCIVGKLQLENGKPIIIVTKQEDIIIQK